MSSELKERSVGQLIGQVFSLTGEHFPKLFMIFLIASVPVLLVQVFASNAEAQAMGQEGVSGMNIAGMIVFGLAHFIIQPICYGICTLLVAGSFLNRKYSLGESFRFASSKFFSILGYSFMTGLITGIGFLLFVVPGIIFATWYYLGTPALVVENLKTGPAMARSKYLSDGSRWNIFAFLVFFGFVVGLPVAGISMVLAVTIDPNSFLFHAINYVIGAAVTTIAIVAPIAFYFNQRVKKEALDVQVLAGLVKQIGQSGQP